MKTQATTKDVENLLNEDYKETMKTLKPKLIPMTEEEEYRNAGITKEEMLFPYASSTNRLWKIVDKLEKRIATLEKVLESHAKCIGEMRDKKDD